MNLKVAAKLRGAEGGILYFETSMPFVETPRTGETIVFENTLSMQRFRVTDVIHREQNEEIVPWGIEIEYAVGAVPQHQLMEEREKFLDNGWVEV